MKPILQLDRRTAIALGILGATSTITPRTAVAQEAVEPAGATAFPLRTSATPLVFLDHSDKEIEEYLSALAAKEAAEVISHAQEMASPPILAKGRPHYDIDASGNRSVYAHMHTTPVLTYHHFRTVRV